MGIAIIAALSSLFGVIVGGFVSYFLQKQKLEHEFKLKLQENKTENMAEQTALYYLKECDAFKEHNEGKLKIIPRD